MITSIQERCFQLFSQTVPSHLNESPYHYGSSLRPVPLVASVGQPKLQHSTLLTNTFRNWRRLFTTRHTLALWERLIPSQKWCLL